MLEACGRRGEDAALALHEQGDTGFEPAAVVDPFVRALSGRLTFTVRRHKTNKDSFPRERIGTQQPVKARFWPWLEPFSVRKSFK